MNQPTSSTESDLVTNNAWPAPSTGEIDRSSRPWLMALLIASSFWLVVAAVFSLIASIKFHGPNFLADSPALTYGRIRPAHVHCLIYGFCVQAGLGFMTWMFARLGKSILQQPIIAQAGLAFYNLGMAAGIFGILSGDASGYEFIEFPSYASAILFLGYVLLGWVVGLTLHHRAEPGLYVSQWFLIAALLWFPWIFSTAGLLLLGFPQRGIVQSVTAWWYADNLQTVWMWLMGIGAVFYFIPKLTGRALHSRHLALFTFWIVLLFASWGGMPASAPLPAWMPVLSTVARVLSVFIPISVFLSLNQTLKGVGFRQLWGDTSSRFIVVGTLAFFLVALSRFLTAVPAVSALIDFTWFPYAMSQLNAYAFLSMILFGWAYYAAARLPEIRLCPRLAKAHFWLALTGLF